MKKNFIFLFVLFLGINSFSQCPLTTAVDFTATDINGVQHNLFSYLNNNKYVVIDFFYTTCVPCQQAAPKVQGAYEHFGCNESNVIFLSIDRGDNNQEVQQFGQTYGIHCPKISGVEGGGTDITTTYGITAFPTVIMIAPNKNIIEQDIWPIPDAAYLIGVISGHGGIPMACSSNINENQSTDNHNSAYLYPNPNSGHFTLKLNLSEKSIIKLSINDISGKKVLDFSDEYTLNGSNESSINAEKLEKGYYFLNIIENGKILKSEKLVILK